MLTFSKYIINFENLADHCEISEALQVKISWYINRLNIVIKHGINLYSLESTKEVYYRALYIENYEN